MRLTLEGADKFKGFLKTRTPAAVDALKYALNLEAQTIMTRSKREFVPVAPDGGTLRNSGFVDKPKWVLGGGRKVSIEFGYGGAAAAYALAVHEHPSDYSPPSWQGKSAEEINWNVPGSGPKYLQKPAEEAEKGFDQRTARRIKRWIERP